LQAKLQNNLSNEPIRITDHESEAKVEKKTQKENAQKPSFVWKDIKRTLLVTSIILLLMLGLYFYLNSTNSEAQIAKNLLKIIGL